MLIDPQTPPQLRRPRNFAKRPDVETIPYNFSTGSAHWFYQSDPEATANACAPAKRAEQCEVSGLRRVYRRFRTPKRVHHSFNSVIGHRPSRADDKPPANFASTPRV